MRRNHSPTSQQQEYWLEMNRRDYINRQFENANPETDQQIEELNAEKSTEEQGRLQWDRDWESQNRATTVSAHNTAAAPPAALSAPMTGEEANTTTA